MIEDYLDCPDCPLCGALGRPMDRSPQSTLWWYRCTDCRFQYTDSIDKEPEDAVAFWYDALLGKFNDPYHEDRMFLWRKEMEDEKQSHVRDGNQGVAEDRKGSE